jgi:hypothetical protein
LEQYKQWEANVEERLWMSELMMRPRGAVRIVALATMAQEHFHGELRALCRNDDRAANIELNMGRAMHHAFLKKTELGMQPRLAASRVRKTDGDAHVEGFDGCGVPSA